MNGIRGKSTVVRLITAILTEANTKVVGKTTGTAARMLYWYTNEEYPIKRKLVGPNIGEQRKVVATAANLGAEALVSECMAVNPDYQIVFQNQLLQANIGVIVNVIEDHMEVMGPTLDYVAEAFTATIPYHGKLIIAQGPYVDFFTKIAQERHTEVFLAESDKITESQLAKFDYLIFPENVALALAFAKALNIDEEVAWQGMLKSNPDPGVLRVSKIKVLGKDTYFVNGFAVNDAHSTLTVWQRVKDLNYPAENPVIIMNCRKDRVVRSKQFAESVLPYIPASLTVAIGFSTKPIVDAYQANSFQTNSFLNLEEVSGEEVYKTIEEQISGKLIFGIGNIHGTAEEFMESILNRNTATNQCTENKGEISECTEQNYILQS